MFVSGFNKIKAINSLLLIAKEIANDKGISDKYTALKMLYFAEVKHLAKYGRLITDDEIATLPHGSTPSRSYDLLKKQNNEPSFEILNSTDFIGKVNADIDELSESEVECLKLSVAENISLTFPQLKAKAHDEAYNMAINNNKRFVPIEYLVKQEKLSEPEIAAVREHYDFIESVQWLNL